MSDRTLINLLVPDQINDQMKSVCTDLGLTRTAFILTSIEPRIRLHESRQMHRESPGVRHSHTLPDFFSSNDVEVVNGDW